MYQLLQLFALFVITFARNEVKLAEILKTVSVPIEQSGSQKLPPFGIAFDGSHLWVGSLCSKLHLSRINPKDGSRTEYLLPITMNTGAMAYDPSRKELWISDCYEKKFHAFEILRNELKLVRTVIHTLPIAFLDGLSFNQYSGHLWASPDNHQKTGPSQIYELDATNGRILTQFVLPGDHWAGIATDGKLLWLMNQMSETESGRGEIVGFSFTGNIVAGPVVAGYPRDHEEDLTYDDKTFAPNCSIWSSALSSYKLFAWKIPCPHEIEYEKYHHIAEELKALSLQLPQTQKINPEEEEEGSEKEENSKNPPKEQEESSIVELPSSEKSSKQEDEEGLDSTDQGEKEEENEEENETISQEQKEDNEISKINQALLGVNKNLLESSLSEEEGGVTTFQSRPESINPLIIILVIAVIGFSVSVAFGLIILKKKTRFYAEKSPLLFSF